ncbi:glycosyltransferase [Paenibacillus sp. DMB5]|uniref:glycosyltransferase n=1 Tax=Paenibacillus sp. DMB5 TaxID=1780103 RepID=UPI00076D5C7A|nr:glycosyltransferase [Paenibacillus sp. DMB5]KUP22642.1 sugar transferase [Paenibacillus sp. DMB5]
MLAPVLIFVYARPDHTMQTIESLAMNFMAKDTNIYIFSDAPKNETVSKRVEEVRSYIDKLKTRGLFKSVKLIKTDINKGLANSIISGVSELIERYGKVIVLEDDLVTSPDFLNYMNDALNFYEKDKKIWSISGYTFKMSIPADYKSSVYLSYRGSSWGWGTWSDRWNKIDWNVNDYDEFKGNKNLRKKFNRGGRDMSEMLDSQMKGEIDSWAIRWCYSQSKLNMYTIYPTTSRVRNIGLDGSGTHSGVNRRFDVLLNTDTTRCEFNNPELNSKILKMFKNQFGTRFDYFIHRNRTMIKKMLRI